MNNILEAGEYDELIRFNTSLGKGKVKIIGRSTEVNELVVELRNNQKGFLLARVLGNNMTPENLVQLGFLMRDSKSLQKKIMNLLPMKD